MPHFTLRNLIPLAILVPILVPRPDARACMPDVDTPALQGDAALLAAPVADFQQELRSLVPRADPSISFIAPPEARYDEDRQAIETDAADAADVLAVTHDAELAEKLTQWRADLRAKKSSAVPAGLPVEFALYESGAAAYHAGDLAAARTEWQKLLALPINQRAHRTLWATYMIGRSLVDTDPAQAIPLFEKVRALADIHAADPLGLAAASLGWEARAQWQLHHVQAALRLYLQQDAAGDPTAPWSLRDCAAQLIKGSDAALKQAAALPEVQTIITAYILSHGGPFGYVEPSKPGLADRWLGIMQSLAVKNMPGADRLAWTAYDAGDYQAADRWLTLGGANGRGTALGQWIQAKLFLRQGDTAKAMTCLANASRAFPTLEYWSQPDQDFVMYPARTTAGELAELTLARRHYVEAFDLLYTNGFLPDADYVGERVLTVDELKAYIDKHIPPTRVAPGDVTHPDGPDDRAPLPALFTQDKIAMRELLARRLTRGGRWKEARRYFTPEHQKLLDQYIAAIRDGHDAGRSAAQRAESLWTAAVIARTQGDVLLGTAVDGGPTDHDSDEMPVLRTDSKIAPISADEKGRVDAAAPVPDKRWHYRYIAADHAWQAVQLMPNNTDLLARRLIEAASWIKAQDPKAADRFYKALVTRCAGTPLGQAADKLHWFPPLPPDPAGATPAP